jgi:CDP-diglyceride synthetase
MMEIRWLGTLMILPTVSVAIWIAWMCRSTKDVFINLAVLCWIVANSAWMLMEFFDKEQYKHLTALPFGFGLIFTLYFYFLIFKEKRLS